MISIIVPVYNAETYLVECLTSIAQQTYKDIEVICVDDGSKDNSLSILKRWESSDARFVVISQSNQGVSAARNQALEVVKGDFVCFIDSDDVIAPDYLSHLLELAKDGSFAVCGYTRDEKDLGRGKYGVNHYDAKGFIIHILDESIDHPNICMMLFKKNIIHDNNIMFTVGCFRNEDTEFYIRYLTYENEVKVSKYKAYFYRTNPASAMGAPLSVKSLTSIEASKRINKYLFERGLIENEGMVLSNGVLTYAYSIAKRHDLDLYNYLHNNYDVSAAMKKMLSFPRFSKKLVAVFYLSLGKNLFFHLVGVLRFLNISFLRQL